MAKAPQHFLHGLCHGKRDQILRAAQRACIGQRLGGVALRMDQRNRPIFCIQFQLEHLRLCLYPLPGYTPFQQADQELLPQNGQAFLIIAPQFFNITLIRELLVQLAFQLFERLRKLLCIDRLEQILCNIQFDGLLCIFEIIKPRKNNHFYRRHLFCNMLAQLQAIHKRHLDIGHNHIRVQMLGQFQRFHTIFRTADYFISQSIPIDLADDSFTNLLLIIHHNYTILSHRKLLY